MYMLEKIYFIVSGSGRIIGGRPKLDRESPNTWQVARVKREKNSILPHVFCGGVLLSKKYILSAAHCGPPTTGKDKVLIGAKAKYEVDKIRPLSHKYHTHDKHQIFHSATHGPFTVYDFMILILKAPFHACVSDFVRLPKKSDDDNLLGTPLLAVGWGSILPATHEQILRDILGAPKKYPDRKYSRIVTILPLILKPKMVKMKVITRLDNWHANAIVQIISVCDIHKITLVRGMLTTRSPSFGCIIIV